MRKEVQAQEVLAEVLFQGMPMEKLGQDEPKSQASGGQMTAQFRMWFWVCAALISAYHSLEWSVYIPVMIFCCYQAWKWAEK